MNPTRRQASWMAAALMVAALLMLSATVQATGISVDDPMPNFTMMDCEGNEHSLSDYEDKVVVLDFRSQNCPWSRGADTSFGHMAGKYAKQGVVFLGIDSDRTNTPGDIKAYADKAGISYPILKDVHNRYADRIAASRTPEIYIVNAKGAVVFHGAYDNRTAPDRAGDINYVSKALDEILAGKAVSTAAVKAWGCTIKRVSMNEKQGASAPKDSGSSSK